MNDKKRVFFGAIAAGWTFVIAGTIISYLLVAVLASFRIFNYDLAAKILILTMIMFGGYLTGSIAFRRERLNSFFMGCLCFLPTLLLSIAYRSIGKISFSTIFWIAAIIPIALTGGELARRSKTGKSDIEIANKKKKARWIAASAVIACALFVGIAIMNPMLLFYHPDSLKVPDALNTPGQIIGGDFLQRIEFPQALLQTHDLGEITDISTEGDSSTGKIIIVGTRGALYLINDYKFANFVKFEKRISRAQLIHTSKENYVFMDRGSWSPASVLDSSGKIIWKYEGSSGVDDMAVAEFGEGPKFAVGFNGSGGIHLLDKEGRKIWEQPGSNVWHVEFADVNNDGHLEIVHSDASGCMTVRDLKGAIISKTQPEGYFSDFSLIRWPDDKSKQYALYPGKEVLYMTDFAGTATVQLEAPGCTSLGHAKGVLIKLQPNEVNYLAVIARFEMWNRSVLYVYDSNKNLKYREILPNTCSAIAAYKNQELKGNTLLVGCKDKLIQYSR